MPIELDAPCQVLLDCVHDLKASLAQLVSPEFELLSPSRAPLEAILLQVPAYAKRLVLEEIRPLEMFYWRHFPMGWRLSFVLPEEDEWGPHRL